MKKANKAPKKRTKVEEESAPLTRADQAPKAVATLYNLREAKIKPTLSDIGLALVATREVGVRIEAVGKALAEATAGIKDEEVKRLAFDIVHRDEEELREKYGDFAKMQICPIVQQTLFTAITTAWFGPPSAARRATTHPAAMVFALYAESFRQKVVLPALGMIANIDAMPEGYNEGQKKDRTRRLSMINPEVMKIITGAQEEPEAKDEIQQGIIRDACRDALISVLAPQCAMDLSTHANGWIGDKGPQIIPTGIVADALIQSQDGEPQLLVCLREGWLKQEITNHL